MTALEITSPRLLLRDFTPQDEAAFVAYREDDPTQARSLLQTFAGWRSAAPRVNFQLAICRRDGGMALVGCCGLRGEGQPPGIAEYGLELAPAWRGRYRLAIETTETMLGFGFETLELDEVVSKTTEANDNVHRLADWYGATVGERAEGALEWRIRKVAWRAGSASRRRRSSRR